MSVLRPTAVAGMFYPAEPEELSRQIKAFLAQVPGPTAGAPIPKAVIAPHAGYVYSGPVAAHAYALLAPARGKIRRVVLMGPSHRVAFRGIATCSADTWESPLGPVAIDCDMVARLMTLPMVAPLDKAHQAEHSLEVQVPFLQTVLGEFKLVPLVVGETPRDMVAAVLEEAWGGPETLIVVSSDLSHYLDYDSCQATDAATRTAIERLDPAVIGSSQACGRVPMGGLLTAARAHGMTITTLDVRNSGDTAGPRDKVVGYGAWALYEPEDKLGGVGQHLVDYAWAAIRAHLAHDTFIPPASGQPAALGQPGACFVTLKRQGALRGCIGSAQAWRPLIEDVVDNAVKAAFGDPRFPALRADELEGLTLSVSVLTPPEPMSITSQDDLLRQLRPGIDGLIIADGSHRALFLPSVWEQLPDPAQFLTHLKLKAGLRPDHWSPRFAASRFQAVEVR